jgi:hypothetical protein
VRRTFHSGKKNQTGEFRLVKFRLYLKAQHIFWGHPDQVEEDVTGGGVVGPVQERRYVRLRFEHLLVPLLWEMNRYHAAVEMATVHVVVATEIQVQVQVKGWRQ